MLTLNGVAFSIGAECASHIGADRLREDFEKALTGIGVTLPNVSPHGETRQRRYHAGVCSLSYLRSGSGKLLP